MTDIVHRLRKWPDRPDQNMTTNVTAMMKQAADEIERLRTRTFTKADVEAVAMSLAEQDRGVGIWGELTTDRRVRYRSIAHAALSAIGEVEG